MTGAEGLMLICFVLKNRNAVRNKRAGKAIKAWIAGASMILVDSPNLGLRFKSYLGRRGQCSMMYITHRINDSYR